jgi:hypothetical protein
MVSKRAMSARVEVPEARKPKSDGLRENKIEQATREAMAHNRVGNDMEASPERDKAQMAMGSGDAPMDEQPIQSVYQRSQLLRAAQVYRDATGIVFKSFQTLLLLSLDSLRAWQTTWLAMSRPER